MKNSKNFLLALALSFSFWPMAPVCAAEFVKPTFDKFVKTLIRLGAIDPQEDRIVDLYARVVHCPAVLEHYRDDFHWEKYRAALREEIRKTIHAFPTSYAYETAIRLGRYDFQRRMFPFVGEQAGLDVNVNTFSISLPTGEQNYCSDDNNRWLPLVYRFVLDKPVKMSGLFMGEEDGHALLKRMDAAGNITHIVFPRLNIRAVFVAKLADGEEITAKQRRKAREGGLLVSNAEVLQEVTTNGIRLDSRLESIEYYEDEARTKLIYTYRP